MSETEDGHPSVAQKIITEFLARNEVKRTKILRPLEVQFKNNCFTKSQEH